MAILHYKFFRKSILDKISDKEIEICVALVLET